ncbi:hypothetical protein E3P98_02031 [Wallemia ichthyophaga]|nr:hypothetical protein E3P98_02031 [Wallemia ichthyophaga]
MDPIKQELLKSGKIDTHVPEQRLSHFNSGSNYKSARDKQKEADEQRRLEEDTQTQMAYKEYLDAFDDVRQSSFVKSGNGRESYSHQPKSHPVELNSQGKIKGKTQMDSFLQELKREQTGRGSRSDPDFHSDADPHSTNLYVANLPTWIDERIFGEYFAQFGAIASVKILWPRPEDQHKLKQPGYAGFISFMTRHDAETALKQLDGSDWQGHMLKVDWGKRVRIPSRPLYESTAKRPAPSRSRSPSSFDQRESKRSRVEEEAPGVDGKTLNFLLSVVSYAKSHDKGPSACLEELKWLSEEYAFLNNDNDTKSRFVLNQLDNDIPFDDSKPTADSENDLSEQEQSEHESIQKQKQNILGGVAKKKLERMLRQITPKRSSIGKVMAFAIDHSEAYEGVVGVVIKSLLNVSTPVPRKIARLHLVSDILANSAVSISGAWKYRDEIQRQLPKVFDHLGLVRSTFPSKLSQNFFKERIEVVLTVWAELFIFPQNILDDYLIRLEGVGRKRLELDRSSTLVSRSQNHSDSASSHPITPVVEEMEKPTGFKPFIQGAEEVEEDIDGAPIDDIDGEPIEGDGEDIDGEPMEDINIDGQSLHTYQE